MLDMPVDSDDVLTTKALYRTTFVLVYRSDRGIHLKNLDDPQLKKLTVGVYETSAIREALTDHAAGKIQVHYLSHNADLVPENQPSYQVQQVIDGKLDVAAVWGPMAGYFRKQAPLVIQPANLMDDTVPLEFDMALAVRRSDHDLQQRLDKAMQDSREELRAVLNDFAVPLVKCDSCVIDGDLPAHGPYQAPKSSAPAAHAQEVSIAQLDEWLKHGANVNVELNNAVLADDQKRVAYLLDKKHASVGAPDMQGELPLHHAIIQGSPSMVAFLIARGADVNQRDRDGWTPLMQAGYCDDAADVKVLKEHGGDPNAAQSAELHRARHRHAVRQERRGAGAGGSRRRPGQADRRGRLHPAHARHRQPRAAAGRGAAEEGRRRQRPQLRRRDRAHDRRRQRPRRAGGAAGARRRRRAGAERARRHRAVDRACQGQREGDQAAGRGVRASGRLSLTNERKALWQEAQSGWLA